MGQRFLWLAIINRYCFLSEPPVNGGINRSDRGKPLIGKHPCWHEHKTDALSEHLRPQML